jgi:hypothetical protein
MFGTIFTKGVTALCLSTLIGILAGKQDKESLFSTATFKGL